MGVLTGLGGMEVNPESAAVQVSTDEMSEGGGLPSGQKKRGSNSREIGLTLGLLAGKYLLGLKHLHYGIWPKELPVRLSNFGAAQQHFANFIQKRIPPTVSSILDVGCGAGALAQQLASAGYRVDCVCPNPALVREARRRLKGRAQIYECPFETLETGQRYDLFLFSESFQYIRTWKCIEKTLQLSHPGAFVLICDFFKTDAAGESVIGGGTNLREFYGLIGRYRCFEKLNDIDITDRTAPTMEVVNDVLRPAAAIWRTLRWLSGGQNSPLLSAFGKDFPARVGKIERKYFSGLRTAQHFSTYKCYRLMLFRRSY